MEKNNNNRSGTNKSVGLDNCMETSQIVTFAAFYTVLFNVSYYHWVCIYFRVWTEPNSYAKKHKKEKRTQRCGSLTHNTSISEIRYQCIAHWLLSFRVMVVSSSVWVYKSKIFMAICLSRRKSASSLRGRLAPYTEI